MTVVAAAVSPAVARLAALALDAAARDLRRDGHTRAVIDEVALLRDVFVAAARPVSGCPPRTNVDVSVTTADTGHMAPMAVTIAGAAERFGVSERTVRRLVEAGDLGVVRLGASVRIPLSELDRLIQERTERRVAA